MAPYDRHVFVCVNRRPDGHPRGCCLAKGSDTLRERLKVAVKNAGLAGRVRINGSLCLDQCERGATVVVYPEGTWYVGVRASDVAEIFAAHLVDGLPVERLRDPRYV